MANLNEKTVKQYNRYPYPAPIEDLDEHLSTTLLTDDPKLNFRELWPRTGYPGEGFSILVAGCGTNQGACIARTNPEARVVGVDVSETSLEHERHLKRKYSLDNLTLSQLDLNKVHQLGEEFDMIISTGVLHHLPDPGEGFRNLRRVLKRDGVMSCMLYAKYGRTGVYMFQELARSLGLKRDEAGVQAMRDMLGAAPQNHTVHWSADHTFDAGVVDLFLNPQDRPFTVGELLDTVRNAGFEFAGWQDKAIYSPLNIASKSADAYLKLMELPTEEQWKAMELISGQIKKHQFFICRDDKDKDLYQVDLNRDTLDRYVPFWHPMVTLEKAFTAPPAGHAVLKRHIHTFSLNLRGVALTRHMNDENTVLQCMELGNRELPEQDPDLWKVIRNLWRLGHIQLMEK